MLNYMREFRERELVARIVDEGAGPDRDLEAGHRRIGDRFRRDLGGPFFNRVLDQFRGATAADAAMDVASRTVSLILPDDPADEDR